MSPLAGPLAWSRWSAAAPYYGMKLSVAQTTLYASRSVLSPVHSSRPALPVGALS